MAINGFNETDVQEGAVLCSIIMYLLKIKDEDVFNDDVPKRILDTKLAQTEFKGTQKELKFIETCVKYLKTHKKMLEDGKKIVEETNRSLGKKAKTGLRLNNFKIHHGDDIFNSIRKKAKDTIGIQEDKWNPSDLYIIKNDCKINDIINKKESIYDYNDKIGDYDLIHGFSLKMETAVHGSLSWNSALKYLKIPTIRVSNRGCVGARFKKKGEDVWYYYSNANTIRHLEAVYNYLKSIDSPNRLFYIYGYNKEIKEISPENYILKSANWDKTIIGFEEFVRSVEKCRFSGKDGSFGNNSLLNKLEKVIAFSYIYATSRLPVSCRHKKCQTGKEIDFMQPGSIFLSDVILTHILFPIDGSATIIAKILVRHMNGSWKVRELEFRSKDSAAQFNVVQTRRTTDDVFSISDINISFNKKGYDDVIKRDKLLNEFIWKYKKKNGKYTPAGDCLIKTLANSGIDIDIDNFFKNFLIKWKIFLNFSNAKLKKEFIKTLKYITDTNEWKKRQQFKKNPVVFEFFDYIDKILAMTK